MRLGAIIVIAADSELLGQEAAASTAGRTENDKLIAEPLACVEILGRPMVERAIEQFRIAHVETISVLVDAELSHTLQGFPGSFEQVKVEMVEDVSAAITQRLKDYSESGIEHSFVACASAYVETDFLDFFYFHREARQTATRAFDGEGPLDVWVVDCAEMQQGRLDDLLAQAGQTDASYFVRGYVNRLRHPHNLRRIAVDGLRGRCTIRPSGQEISPGVWIEEGAEIHRRARIVAPAFVGRGSRVREDTVITRFSSIERLCYIDYGTVIEDSSIFANSRIGMCLDICHAVIKENKLLSLERDVVLQISDPRLLRSTVPVEGAGARLSRLAEEPQNIQDLDNPAPEAWQLGADLIQG